MVGKIFVDEELFRTNDFMYGSSGLSKIVMMPCTTRTCACQVLWLARAMIRTKAYTDSLCISGRCAMLMSLQRASVEKVNQTTGIVEGSWVIGFFADGQEAQGCYIMGTIAGAASFQQILQEVLMIANGVYAKYVDESDVNKLARGIYY